MINLNHTLLSQKMKAVLLSKNVNTVSIDHAVDSLIQTSLRGVDSHGIHLYPHYCRAVDSGRINKNPNIEINKTASGTALINADHAFGHHAGAVAIDYACELALQSGIAAVNVQNSTHFGAAAYFALRASNKNLIGFSFTNADALVKAFGSKQSFFGTNPICFTAPLANEEPFCLDMATSLVSWNKIKNYRKGNKSVPSHWAFDKEGLAVTDPHKAASVNPAGEYKGFGLGMMVDILCAVIGGGLIGKDILPMFDSPIEARRKISHFFMAIDIDKFIPVEVFKTNLQSVVDRIRMLPALDNEQVMVAGDPEKKSFKLRSVAGIPIEENIFDEFLAIDAAFNETVIGH